MIENQAKEISCDNENTVLLKLYFSKGRAMKSKKEISKKKIKRTCYCFIYTFPPRAKQQPGRKKAQSTKDFPFVIVITLNYRESQPPVLKSGSSFLAMTVGIWCCSHTVRRKASYLFWLRNS